MNWDPGRIFAYYPKYRKKDALVLAVSQMLILSIKVVWQGARPGRLGGLDTLGHQFSLNLNARETNKGDPVNFAYL